MNLNDDFTRRASVHAGGAPWIPSPMQGVERKLLDRIGGEVARATSIVRYAPGSAFSAHVHTGGEEFLVLVGVFQDEHGDYPVGSYVRNPPQTRHTPRSETGCTILVKLWQFDLADRCEVSLRTATTDLIPDPQRPGVLRLDLHADPREQVRLETWAPGATVDMQLPGGAELFVLDGDFAEGGERFERHSWLRLPAGARLQATAGANGVRLWTKLDHLERPQTAPEA